MTRPALRSLVAWAWVAVVTGLYLAQFRDYVDPVVRLLGASWPF